MKYRQLLANLSVLPDTQLDQDVTIYFAEIDEYMPAKYFYAVMDSGVLDPDHMVIEIPK